MTANMTRTDLAYRKVAAESTSGLGLLIALYDTLAGNLRRAATAQRADDIESRCLEMTHAFTVIGYLESGLQESPGGELTQQLAAFYVELRKRLMDAQAKQSAEILEQEMARVLRLRGKWQQVELGHTEQAPEITPTNAPHAIPTYRPNETAHKIGGWSA